MPSSILHPPSSSGESTTGLILRTRPLTETSLIVNWLTPDFGRISTVAKGARRAKSPFAGKLDLFYLADFSFARSRRSELHALREVKLRETHAALRRDLATLRQASYCAALVEQVTETETPLPKIFDLAVGFIGFLSHQPARARNIFAFELKLLHELGLQPETADSRLGRGAQALVAELAGSGWAQIARIEPEAGAVKELRQFLHGFLIFHLGKFPRGRAEALAARAD